MAELFAKRYQILEKIGEGSMGKVLKARDTWLGRFVAIKLLWPHLVEDPRFAPLNFLRRFLREARELARLEHSNIVSVYDMGEESNNPYIIMPFIEGLTLDKFLQQKKYDNSILLNIAIDICDAISYSHSMEIVHRDLKPSNIIITSDLHVKVTDFGLARRMDSNTELTSSNSTIGTAAYISPEQAMSSKVDYRADLYSFGIILYEIFTGQYPFSQGNVPSLILQHLSTNPRKPSSVNPLINPKLEKIIMTLMEKKPENRYDSAEILLKDLIDMRDCKSDFNYENICKEKEYLCPSHIYPVGRENLIARLSFLVDRVKSGNGAMCLMVGPTGIGKTRLLSEVSNFASLKNIKVIYNCSGEIDSIIPFFSLENLLCFFKLHDALFPYGYSVKFEEQLAENSFDNIVENFYEAFSKAVRAFNEPIVLIFDDLFFSTYTTQKFISSIIENSLAAELPILWCLSFEDVIFKKSNPFYKCVNFLYENGKIEVMKIPSLSKQDFSAILKLYNITIDTDLLSYLHSACRGRPFYFLRLLSRLDEIEKNFLEKDIKLSDLILGSESSMKLAQLLAVSDGILPVNKAVHILGVTEDYFTTLSECGAFYYDKDNGTIYFSHPLYKYLVYDKISFDIKKDMHKKLALLYSHDINNTAYSFFNLSRSAYHFLMGDCVMEAYDFMIHLMNSISMNGAYSETLNLAEIIINKINNIDDFPFEKKSAVKSIIENLSIKRG